MFPALYTLREWVLFQTINSEISAEQKTLLKRSILMLLRKFVKQMCSWHWIVSVFCLIRKDRLIARVKDALLRLTKVATSFEYIRSATARSKYTISVKISFALIAVIFWVFLLSIATFLLVPNYRQYKSQWAYFFDFRCNHNQSPA